ncbi:MAG: sulfite exporter TauE/SafE family protein [Planctomycetota bacterium]|jgi:sulfite exporter TauE/SafE
MNDGIMVLCSAAAAIGFVHTILGPDHYLPFVAMSRAGGWSLKKTGVVTVLCGIGHVLSSAILGLIGIAFGVAVFKLENIERARGDLAGWLLLAFGFVYFAWGVRRAIRNKPHTHRHAHADGTLHAHTHTHAAEHVHLHDRTSGAGSLTHPPLIHNPQSAIRNPQSMTPWVLFTIFVFGPCEPLIPILMYPAATGDMWDVALVTAVFGLTTLATMTTVVVFACAGLGSAPFGKLARYSHALAGFVILACGAAVKAGL